MSVWILASGCCRKKHSSLFITTPFLGPKIWKPGNARLSSHTTRSPSCSDIFCSKMLYNQENFFLSTGFNTLRCWWYFCILSHPSRYVTAPRVQKGTCGLHMLLFSHSLSKLLTLSSTLLLSSTVRKLDTLPNLQFDEIWKELFGLPNVVDPRFFMVIT